LLRSIRNGEKLKEFSPFDDAEIEKRLTRAENASRKYRGTAFGQRSELMAAVAELLLLEKDRLAEIITLEMGKLFSASLEEVQKCARGCRFYADNAERFLEDEPAQTDAARSYVHYDRSDRSSLSCRGISRSGRSSICSASAHGWKRRFAETCFECAAVRSCH
jgi:acyl-CoA reductase-like NAD-dependent aldehyde dehydrogenase